jgi:hypothetical protein
VCHAVGVFVTHAMAQTLVLVQDVEARGVMSAIGHFIGIVLLVVLLIGMIIGFFLGRIFRR